MTINKESICTQISSKDFRDFHKEYSIKASLQDPENSELYKTKISFHEQSGFRILVLSKTSKDNLENYSIPKEIKLDVLRSLPNRKDIIQVDSQNCIKYIKTNDTLSVINCFRKSNVLNGMNNDTLIHTHFFSVNLDNGYIVMDNGNTYNKEEVDNIKKLVDDFYSKFLVVVTYLELTDVTYKVVDSVLSKKRKSYHYLKNSSRFNVIHVRSNWNTNTINLNSFDVRGHFRLQPCGVGRLQYKYIYIQPFKKGLVRRLPQKQLV